MRPHLTGMGSQRQTPTVFASKGPNPGGTRLIRQRLSAGLGFQTAPSKDFMRGEAGLFKRQGLDRIWRYRVPTWWPAAKVIGVRPRACLTVEPLPRPAPQEGLRDRECDAASGLRRRVWSASLRQGLSDSPRGCHGRGLRNAREGERIGRLRVLVRGPTDESGRKATARTAPPAALVQVPRSNQTDCDEESLAPTPLSPTWKRCFGW